MMMTTRMSAAVSTRSAKLLPTMVMLVHMRISLNIAPRAAAANLWTAKVNGLLMDLVLMSQMAIRMSVAEPTRSPPRRT